eukprot:Lankesteria_metandrocarpae@DN4610_c0_g1_i2.p2
MDRRAAPTAKQWTNVHDKYKMTAMVGQGTYGRVYRGEKRSNPSEEVALKRAKLDAFTDFGIPETAIREVTILRDLQHENIMRVHEVSCSTSRLYMVCEYMEMDLKKFIKAQGCAIAPNLVKRITFEILKGLSFCHGHRIMHRDLKPHNILLDKDAKQVKLADFGLARAKHNPNKTITHDVVTLWYRAPELLLGECKYSDAIDIWSVGCIVVEMLSGKALFPGDSEIDTLFKIFRMFGTPHAMEWPDGAMDPLCNFPPFPRKEHPFSSCVPNLDAAGEDFLLSLLNYLPSARSTALAAMEHRWFDDIRPPMKKEENMISKMGARQLLMSDSMIFFDGKDSAVYRAAGRTSRDSINSLSTATGHADFSAATSTSTNASPPRAAQNNDLQCCAVVPTQIKLCHGVNENCQSCRLPSVKKIGSERRSSSSPSQSFGSGNRRVSPSGLSSEPCAAALPSQTKGKSWWRWQRGHNHFSASTERNRITNINGCGSPLSHALSHQKVSDSHWSANPIKSSCILEPPANHQVQGLCLGLNAVKGKGVTTQRCGNIVGGLLQSEVAHGHTEEEEWRRISKGDQNDRCTDRLLDPAEEFSDWVTKWSADLKLQTSNAVHPPDVVKVSKKWFFARQRFFRRASRKESGTFKRDDRSSCGSSGDCIDVREGSCAGR